eukprot:m.313201 g.313201  ORF g.313201 m.313201 type:complete len:79 (+) comp359719_c0_seq1:143-379(+)
MLRTATGLFSPGPGLFSAQSTGVFVCDEILERGDATESVLNLEWNVISFDLVVLLASEDVWASFSRHIKDFYSNSSRT